ncbi:MAG: endonuclease III [Deltaproteobacteria bacterium]|nr:MAG: endonuclease III [Deltaproteobacteria bacterium]
MPKKQSNKTAPSEAAVTGKSARTPRVPFNIDRFVDTLKTHYHNWDAPVITLIASHGGSPFEILVSTILSLRTKDEVTAKAAKRILSKADTPAKLWTLDEKAIEKLIYPVGFYPTKARQLRRISQILLEKFDGRVPDRMDDLLALPGVGRKTANLVLAEGFGQAAICVDTHVHRISNRIGYVSTRTPEKTEFALRDQLPPRHWNIYNELLVAFGQVLCRPISPWCSRCPVADMCPQIDVKKTR